MENVLGNTKYANCSPLPLKDKRTPNPEVVLPEESKGGKEGKEGKEGWGGSGMERAGRVLEWLAARGVKRGDPA